MDYEKIGYGFIIAFILLTIYSGINNDKFVDEISNGSFWQALSFYLLSRVDYLLIFLSIFLLRISTPIREFFAGISLIWAIDIVTYPRLPSSGFPADISFRANSDYLFMSKLLELTHWQYSFAWKFYYIVFPIALILLTGWLLGFHLLGRRIIS